MKWSIFRHEKNFNIMKSNIRHETSLFPVMEFFWSVMNSKSRHEKFPRHESLTTSWNPLFFRHEILFPPSWFCTIGHESVLSRNRVGFSGSRASTPCANVLSTYNIQFCGLRPWNSKPLNGYARRCTMYCSQGALMSMPERAWMTIWVSRPCP